MSDPHLFKQLLEQMREDFVQLLAPTLEREVKLRDSNDRFSPPFRRGLRGGG